MLGSLKLLVWKFIIINLLIILSFQIVQSEKQASGTKITVYYFHHTMRCESCLKIEQLTFNTLKKYFSKELRDSNFIWKTIDVDKTENQHFEEDYKLETQAIILSKSLNEKELSWKNLDKIWDFIDNPNNFGKYIKEEIRFFKKK